jgi:hypothetical protein
MWPKASSMRLRTALSVSELNLRSGHATSVQYTTRTNSEGMDLVEPENEARA